jgi:hypothetical protein
MSHLLLKRWTHEGPEEKPGEAEIRERQRSVIRERQRSVIRGEPEFRESDSGIASDPTFKAQVARQVSDLLISAFPDH